VSIKYHLEVFITAEGRSFSYRFGGKLLLKLASFDIVRNKWYPWKGFNSNSEMQS
jgi:hypothetical protein